MFISDIIEGMSSHTRDTSESAANSTPTLKTITIESKSKDANSIGTQGMW